MRVAEVDIAREIIEYLKADGWEIYQEVKYGSHYADIVAKRGPVIWVIEAKVSFGLDVIEQAANWLDKAHMVSVAVTWTRKSHFKNKICEKFGIGVLTWKEKIDPYYDFWNVKEQVRPEFHRKIRNVWDQVLKPEHQTFCEAGSTGAKKRFTPFQDTCQQLIRLVNQKPGIEIGAALKEIKHHYKTPSSARSSLVSYILKGIIPELRTEYVNKKILLFPALPKNLQN